MNPTKMARGAQPVAEPSEFEKQRLANIAERDALLRKLTQEAQQAGLYTKAAIPAAQHGQKRAAKPKQPPAKRVKKEDIAPRRTSSRLAGIQADSEVAQQKAEEQYVKAKEVERERRQRVTEDLKFSYGTALIGTDVLLKGVAMPYERTFDESDIHETTDKELKALRERMSSLELWDQWEPNRIKITPERIYSMAFHPTATKPIVFAGDKLGTLGIVDASQKPNIKKEDDDEEEDDDDPNPEMTHIKPHTRTIAAMHSHPSKPQTLYTASYDSSIRATDLEKGVAVEVYGPSDRTDDEPVSGVDMAATDPNVIYFTTLNGAFGVYDTRQDAGSATLYQLSEKKIGGFSLNPLAPHYLATASLDRFLRVWDLRKLSRKMPCLVGEHESRLSVSHAAFNTAGQVATTSYDDTIKVHSFGVKSGMNANMQEWKSGFQLDEEAMKPEVVIRHNNQTGRWTTILKPRWQMFPEDNIHKLVVGNMNRFVDVYSADGTQLAQLGGEGITAVPAVAVFHPSKDWIAGGTASGKMCLWL
ncbi:WD40-repeat-containing domain protein [Exophiala viscosa]|uniref:WD40-repeat-containing domain protein n=1 Tax=Exophiala viscosa TaxID=2486360 RepID=UPI002196509C|nr:WD40-repeat-containing domain protein [Exophiala viscosa]